MFPCLLLLAEIYSTLRQLDLAKDALVCAAQILRKRLNVDNSINAVNCGLLAEVFLAHGFLQEADSMLDEYLLQTICIYGRHHIVTSDCYFQLGALCTSQGKYTLAIEFMERALYIRGKVLSYNSETTVNTKYSLAIAYRITKQPMKALGLLKDVFQAYSLFLGPHADKCGDVAMTIAATLLVSAHTCNQYT